MRGCPVFMAFFGKVVRFTWSSIDEIVHPGIYRFLTLVTDLRSDTAGGREVLADPSGNAWTNLGLGSWLWL